MKAISTKHLFSSCTVYQNIVWFQILNRIYFPGRLQSNECICRWFCNSELEDDINCHQIPLWLFGVHDSLCILSFIRTETRSWLEVSEKICLPCPSRKSWCFTFDKKLRKKATNKVSFFHICERDAIWPLTWWKSPASWKSWLNVRYSPVSR